jgi:hypothetical protein
MPNRDRRSTRPPAEGLLVPGLASGNGGHITWLRAINRPRDRQLLLAYAAGMTLDAAARRIGIRPATAKHYLERIKQWYRSAGRPAHTKLDLATRVRGDGLPRDASAMPTGHTATAPRRAGKR